MRILLIWLVLTASCWAQLTATGVATWEDTVAGTKHGAFGPGGAPVLCYQTEDGWDFIRDEFEQVGERQVWRSVNGNHRVFADSTGAAIYAVGNHYLGTETTHLIKFNKADSTWETLKSSEPDSISVNGNRITFHNIFPGVDKQLVNNAKVIQQYAETYIFSQSARDSLVYWEPWPNRLLGTATKLSVDSLNLSLSDIAGAFDIDTVGRMTDGWIRFGEGEASAFYIAETYLQCADSTVQSIPVKKWLVKKSGSFWFVELFNPIAANQLPEGPLWHNATFGYTQESGENRNIENYIRGAVACPSSSGTIDSITGYLRSTGTTHNMRMALYRENTGMDDLDLLDSTAEFGVAANGYAWRSKPALVGASISSGDHCCILAWSGSAGGYGYIIGFWESGVTDSMTYQSLTYDVWPDPNTGQSYEYYRGGIYCTYTESGGPTGQVISILGIVNMFPWGIAR